MNNDMSILDIPTAILASPHGVPSLLMNLIYGDAYHYRYNRSLEFLRALLKNGAPLDVTYYYTVPGVDYHTKIRIMKYCLSKGLDPNFGNTRDDTLFHHVLTEFKFGDTHYEDLDEMVCLLLYYDALPTEEFQHDGHKYTAFDYVCLNMLDEVSSFVFEQLFLYTFGDGECAGKISLRAFLRLVETEKYLKKYKCIRKARVIDELKNLDLEFTVDGNEMRHGLLKSFVCMDFACCADMVKRCPEALKAILEESEVFSNLPEEVYEITKKMNWVIAQENIFNCAVDFFENIDNEELYEIMEDAEEQDAMKLIFFMLQYGFRCSSHLRDFVYEKFGDCQLFRTLLHVDTYVYNPSEPYNNNLSKMFSVIVANFTLTVHNIAETISFSKWTTRRTVLKTDYGYLTPTDANKLLDFFAHPKLVQSFLGTPDLPKSVFNKIQCLPKVPLLQELARDAFKVHLVRSFDVKTTKDFYTLVGSLPIGIGFKRIISLEKKIYNLNLPDDNESDDSDEVD